jgi:hypothetical protein
LPVNARVCMPVQQLPTVGLAAIDTGDSESDLAEFFLPADLGLEALDLDGGMSEPTVFATGSIDVTWPSR